MGVECGGLLGFCHKDNLLKYGQQHDQFLPSLPVENKKPMPKRHGEKVFHRRDKSNATGRPYTRPSIAFHKGSLHYVQRVRIPHRGYDPSSVTQLPILTALHARSPTLFVLIIHNKCLVVNGFFLILEIFNNLCDNVTEHWRKMG